MITSGMPPTGTPKKSPASKTQEWINLPKPDSMFDWLDEPSGRMGLEKLDSVAATINQERKSRASVICASGAANAIGRGVRPIDSPANSIHSSQPFSAFGSRCETPKDQSARFDARSIFSKSPIQSPAAVFCKQTSPALKLAVSEHSKTVAFDRRSSMNAPPQTVDFSPLSTSDFLIGQGLSSLTRKTSRASSVTTPVHGTAPSELNTVGAPLFNLKPVLRSKSLFPVPVMTEIKPILSDSNLFKAMLPSESKFSSLDLDEKKLNEEENAVCLFHFIVVM